MLRADRWGGRDTPIGGETKDDRDSKSPDCSAATNGVGSCGLLACFPRRSLNQCDRSNETLGIVLDWNRWELLVREKVIGRAADQSAIGGRHFWLAAGRCRWRTTVRRPFDGRAEREKWSHNDVSFAYYTTHTHTHWFACDTPFECPTSPLPTRLTGSLDRFICIRPLWLGYRVFCLVYLVSSVFFRFLFVWVCFFVVQPQFDDLFFGFFSSNWSRNGCYF